MFLIICTFSDRAEEILQKAKLSNTLEDLRTANQKLQVGTEAIKEWALGCLGEVLETGIQTVVAIPAEKLPELKEIRSNYAKLTDSTLSIGVGTGVLDAAKALEVAKWQGGNVVIFYTEECDQFLADRAKEQEEGEAEGEAETEVSGELAKAGETIPHTLQFANAKNQGKGRAGHIFGHDSKYKRLAANTINSPVKPLQGGETEFQPDPLNVEALQNHLDVEAPKKQGFHGKISSLAPPTQAPVDPYTDIKTKLATALQALRAQAIGLEELQVLNPQLYQGINDLALAVVEMAKQIIQPASAPLDQLAKSGGGKSPVQKISDVLASKSPNHDCKSGDCYHSAEAMYHLLGGKEAGLSPYADQGHWYVKNTQSGKVHDPHGGPTSGKPKKFATEQPSSKAVALIEDVIRNGPVKKSLEDEVSESPLAKVYLPKPKKPRGKTYVKLPIGSRKGNKIKVLYNNGEVGFKTLSAGQVASKVKGPALLGANTFPASPKEPYTGKK